jgi:putative effector of murein hydrolase LrgA (UPF0299 family)
LVWLVVTATYSLNLLALGALMTGFYLRALALFSVAGAVFGMSLMFSFVYFRTIELSRRSLLFTDSTLVE